MAAGLVGTQLPHLPRMVFQAIVCCDIDFSDSSRELAALQSLGGGGRWSQFIAQGVVRVLKCIEGCLSNAMGMDAHKDWEMMVGVGRRHPLMTLKAELRYTSTFF